MEKFNDNDIEKIQVLYNGCYGRWHPSAKACELYKIRKIINGIYIRRRSDPVFIQIFNELGDEFDDKYSKTMIIEIPKIYENYYEIEEYDGLESVTINYTKYKLDKIENKIKEVLQSTMHNDEKINELQKFILENEI
jgi:hypothetical protein